MAGQFVIVEDEVRGFCSQKCCFCGVCKCRMCLIQSNICHIIAKRIGYYILPNTVLYKSKLRTFIYTKLLNYSLILAFIFNCLICQVCCSEWQQTRNNITRQTRQYTFSRPIKCVPVKGDTTDMIRTWGKILWSTIKHMYNYWNIVWTE